MLQVFLVLVAMNWSATETSYSKVAVTGPIDRETCEKLVQPINRSKIPILAYCAEDIIDHQQEK